MSKNEALPSYEEVTRLATELGLPFSRGQAERMVRFLECLKKWNKAYNLTAIRSYQKMLSHHVADSLSIARFLHGKAILDVGTGAGFPGVPLAILYPKKQFTLLDSVGKKIRFLHEAVRQLGLMIV